MANKTKFWIEVNGNPITEYRDKTGKYFVEGRDGTEYSICLYTDEVQYGALKSVISVDGLNVITRDSTWEKGYVLYPHQVLKIPGWTVNTNDVTKFKFGKKSTVMSSRYTGSVENCGVIGVKLYPEVLNYKTTKNDIYGRVSSPPADYNLWYNGSPTVGSPVYPSHTTINGHNALNDTKMSLGPRRGLLNHGNSVPIKTFNVASSLGISASSYEEQNLESNMATGHGGFQNFKVGESSRNFQPVEIQTLIMYYDDIKGLEKRGIFVKQAKLPNAFPTR